MSKKTIKGYFYLIFNMNPKLKICMTVKYTPKKGFNRPLQIIF
jgi:hypothetical protein